MSWLHGCTPGRINAATLIHSRSAANFEPSSSFLTVRTRVATDGSGFSTKCTLRRNSLGRYHSLTSNAEFHLGSVNNYRCRATSKEEISCGAVETRGESRRRNFAGGGRKKGKKEGGIDFRGTKWQGKGCRLITRIKQEKWPCHIHREAWNRRRGARRGARRRSPRFEPVRECLSKGCRTFPLKYKVAFGVA